MTSIGETRQFENNYPEKPAKLKVGVDSSMFDRERLQRLASMLDPHLVEFNTGDLPLSIAPDAVPEASLTADEIIENIGSCNSWMTLRNIEKDPDYCALAEAALAPLHKVIEEKTGERMQRQSFLFISSPGAVTPFHFDEEHNILIQIEGTKTLTVYSQHDRALASQQDLERFHTGGHRNLPLNPENKDRGETLEMAPGDALYIPPLAPHWVQVTGDAPSLSLSITWRSARSRRALYLHQINHHLRGRGFDPRFPGEAPVTDQLKIWTASGLARLGYPINQG